MQYGELVDYFVTAERIPTHRMDTPANVTVITAADIEANHYQSLADALSHVNGVVVASTSIHQNIIRMNGFGHVLLLIDGHRMNSTQTLHADQKADISAIPSMKMIERIEIVKGGYSALYGTDAVGGVINIITKKGRENETTIDVNTGSWSRYNLELTNQGTERNFNWFLTVGRGRSDAYTVGDIGTSDNGNEYERDSLFLRLDDTFDEDTSLTFTFSHFKNNAVNIANYNHIYNNFALQYNFKESTNTPGWLRYFNNHSTMAQDSLGKSTLQGLEYQNGWELGKHKLIAGLEWNQSKSSPFYDGTFTQYNPRKATNTAFYLQDTFSVTDKWTLIPGIRYDKIKDMGHKASPKLSVNYRADDKTKFYASWGKVYRTPTVTELYGDGYFLIGRYAPSLLGLEGVVDSISMYDRWLGRSRLQPETGHTENIGVEHDFDENTNISLNIFHSKLDNAIEWSGISTWYSGGIRDNGSYSTYNRYRITRATNVGTQKRTGGELTFRKKVNDNFSYDLGYSHVKINNSYGSNYYGQPNGYRIGLHLKKDTWRANLLGVMASGLDTNHFTSTSYAFFDFNFSYDVNDTTTLYFIANNFTDKNYSNFSTDSPAPGRSFLAGAQIKF